MYKNVYVPVDLSNPVCAGYSIDPALLAPTPLYSIDLPLVETDDDLEVLAKVALEDVERLDVDKSLIVEEIKTLERRCEREQADLEEERRITLERIDALNDEPAVSGPKRPSN